MLLGLCVTGDITKRLQPPSGDLCLIAVVVAVPVPSCLEGGVVKASLCHSERQPVECKEAL